MQTMNISLSDPIRQFVEEQVSAGEYSSASEYVGELLRAEQKRRARQQLEDVLVSAIGSGDPIELTPEMIKQTRQRLRHRASLR